MFDSFETSNRLSAHPAQHQLPLLIFALEDGLCLLCRSMTTAIIEEYLSSASRPFLWYVHCAMWYRQLRTRSSLYWFCRPGWPHQLIEWWYVCHHVEIRNQIGPNRNAKASIWPLMPSIIVCGTLGIYEVLWFLRAWLRCSWSAVTTFVMLDEQDESKMRPTSLLPSNLDMTTHVRLLFQNWQSTRTRIFRWCDQRLSKACSFVLCNCTIRWMVEQRRRGDNSRTNRDGVSR